MKEFYGLFGEEFTLKMVNQINTSSHYVKDVKLQSLPADYDEPNEKFVLDEPAKKREYLSPRAKTIDGTIYHNGYPCYIGNYKYRSAIYKSMGGLIILPVYSLENDDYLCAYLRNIKGFVILNKDLEIIYKNLNTSYEYFSNKQEFYDFLHDYGPTALQFVNPEDFNLVTQNALRRVYSLREQTLKDNEVDSVEILKDKELFNKAFNILKKEYQKIQEKTDSKEC
ncbi:MAG: hypothetical protein E7359_01540 [Clostridiales bacterium]|nr:hypothetical protein [Clostridiales bacterium]